METSFCQQLDVVEIFRFADGKTVFVGPLHGDAKYVPPCNAELVVNGHTVGVVHLEGEMMPNGRHPKGYRSLSTTDVDKVKGLSPNNDEIRLRINPQGRVPLDQ
jgi:hypothetical protein